MLVEILARAGRRWRPRIGWLPVVLIVAAVWIATAGIMEADWVRGDALFLSVSTVGMLVGAALARSKLSGPWATLILAPSGLLFVGQVVARVLPPLRGAMRELRTGAMWFWLHLARADPPPPPLAFPLWRDSGTRIATFVERLSSWAEALFSGQSTQNPVAFLFVSGLILWACTAWAVWWVVRRGHPFLAMLPLGALLSMSTYLSSGELGWVIAFAGCVALLLPIVYLNRQERGWDERGIDYSTEIRYDVWQIASLVALAVVVLSVITPSFSIPRLVWGFWELIQRPQEVVQDLLTRFFGGVEPDTPPELPVPAAPGAGRGAVEASLPRSHLLGGSPNLTRQRVMYVCTDAPPPMPEEFFPGEAVVGPKHYWRGITYDTFTGRYWGNSPSVLQDVQAYEPVLASTITNTESLRQRYLIEVPHGVTLYAVGEPDTVDQVVRRRVRAADDLVGLEGTISDYVVYSEVSQATARQLREAPADYSEHIVRRYLSLSQETPARVRALAAEITAGMDTAYDKAVAIERYLRQFTYDLEVSSPRPGQDVVEFFLFDVQRGYCDYYASSFVVLARAAGVPARLAVGYAMGGHDSSRNCYEVVERDGHSWPEVYFAGYGWIPFEPTAPFRLFERPPDPVSERRPPPSVPSVPRRPLALVVRAWWMRVRGNTLTYLVIAAALDLVILLIIQLYRQWWHSRLTSVEAIALYHREMSHLGERLGTARQSHQTPAEYGVHLAQAIGAREVRWPWPARRLDAVTEEASARVIALSRAYEHASYGAHSLLKAHQIQAEREWERLRPQMWWLWLGSQAHE